MSHEYARVGHLPNIGDEPDIDEISEDITSEEIRNVALHDSRYGTGMYDERDFIESFKNYQKVEDTNCFQISPEDLKISVLRCAIDKSGELERFLYTEVGDYGNFRFFAEGHHKRIHKSQDGETVIIEGREQEYDVEGRRELLEALEENHAELKQGEFVRPPSRKDPERVEYNGNPLMKYGFNQEMVSLHELEDEKVSQVMPLVRKAEKEIQGLIAEDRFQTTQPQDFKFTSGETRAETHVLVPTREEEELEELEELIIGDIGETEVTFNNGNGSSRFPI